MRNARQHGLRVVLSNEEHAHIKALAAMTKMSMAEVVRRLTRGAELKSRLDSEGKEEIIRIRGDMNRLGNLLKLWLDQRPNEGLSTQEVTVLAEQIAAVTEEIRHKVRAL